MQHGEIKNKLKDYASRLGFVAVGITNTDPLSSRKSVLKKRSKEGLLSPFVKRDLEQLAAPEKVMPGARSILVAALPYYHPLTSEEREERGGYGYLARFAWGLDYHQVIRDKLNLLVKFMEPELGTTRVFVDTGPLLEKELACRAGLGWMGKNNLLITEDYGSWILLGVVIMERELKPDPARQGRCGDCSLCLEACPTGALLKPYLLDTRICLSQVTQLSQPIKKEIKESLADRIWGCDLCQEACPYNRAPERGVRELAADNGLGPWIDLNWLLSVTEEEFNRVAAATVLGWRGLKVIRRNATIALENEVCS